MINEYESVETMKGRLQKQFEIDRLYVLYSN